MILRTLKKKKSILTIGGCVSVFVFTTQDIEWRTVSTPNRQISNPICGSWFLNNEKLLASSISRPLKLYLVNKYVGRIDTTWGLLVYKLPSAASYGKFLGMLSSTPWLWWILSVLFWGSSETPPSKNMGSVGKLISLTCLFCAVSLELHFLFSEKRITLQVVMSIIYWTWLALCLACSKYLPNGSYFIISIWFLFYNWADTVESFITQP